MDNTSRFHGPAARALRQAAGIRQAEMARLVGVSRSHLANIENSGKQPSLQLAGAIASQLGVDLTAITCTHVTNCGEAA